ncbi:Type II/IV secretion system ATP hydrolase TadA/VirB11/CpaF, TadA subfamily [plant metagenome]|uniref:Type II/IV secretion system ATP hydrolase TadA/VirB11/CpaF, TadA subfamily n=1 Tax=plant metagenome TaxID=1297885 RepID=A0A484TQJ8_9ZZZZ
MLRIHQHFQDGSRHTLCVASPATIGRDPSCAIRLRHWRVARLHARLSRSEAGVVLEDLGSLAGTHVNGRRVAQFAPIARRDQVLIGSCLFEVEVVEQGESAAPAGETVPHALSVMPQGNEGGLAATEQNGDVDGGAVWGTDAVVPGILPQAPELPQGSASKADAAAGTRALHAALRQELRAALLHALDLRRRDVANMSDAMLRTEASQLLAQIVAQRVAAGAVIAPGVPGEVLDETIGLGPLEPLLGDPAITEVMVNRYDEIFVERAGTLQPHEAFFSSEQSLLGVIEKIVAPLGRRIDESSPLVDARLPDGSRVHAVIPPVALKGAALTLRKFPVRRPGLQDLLAGGALDARMASFLSLCVARRKNLVVAGGTGSGKTTLLNVLSHCVPEGERIVTIEDAAELKLLHGHLVSLEARPPNLEGKGAATIRDLVRNALRMRPDRIIVGECRGAEAFDMLAAMNTGHEGSLTTLHANSPRDALARLETMILMAGMALPLQAVREHIAASIDVVVQQTRLPSGRRLVSAIVEVTGIESGRIQLQELFRYDRRSQAFQACGLVPSFFDEWREQGLACDARLFSAETAAMDGGSLAYAGPGRVEAAAC